jgi:protein-tyrosine phosphatase
MTSRIHAFDALDNFRDYGGYDTAAGRALKRGRLFRSAHQASVSAADLERLAALDLGVVVDLRRPVERRRQPSKRAANFTGAVFESDLDERGEAPHITFLKTTDLTPDSGRRFMTEIYRELPFAPAHLDLFGRYFRALGEADRPVLIHCAAGKDRTGMLAALTHHLLGVHHADLMEDYLLTNTAVDLIGRAPAIAQQMKGFTGREPSHDAVVAFMGVEPAYLDAAVGAMTERCGSIDDYLEQALGVDADLRERIAERLAA